MKIQCRYAYSAPGTWAGVFHTEDPVEEIADLRDKIRGGSRWSINCWNRSATPVGCLSLYQKPVSVINGDYPMGSTTSLKVPDLVENHTEFEGSACIPDLSW